MKIMFVLLCSAFMVSAYAAQLKDTTFLAKTNVGGVSISGKVGTLNGRLDGFLIPLKKLKTGVSLRDKHMRKKIFKNKPIFFKGGIQCQSECLLKGTLSIANVEKEVSIGLANKENKYFLKHIIKLSEFKIDAPSFMGVEVKDEVSISSTIHP